MYSLCSQASPLIHVLSPCLALLSMEGIHNSSSIHKPNEQLWKDVNSLLANAMSMQGKLAQKDKELETVRGETQSKIELLDKGLEKHSRSFERMYGKIE